MSSFDLAERMADEYARALGYPKAQESHIDVIRPEAKKYLEVIDGFGFKICDFKVLSPRPYQYYVVFLVKIKPEVKYMREKIVVPYFIRKMQAEFDRGTENPIMELNITEIATHYLISFYSEG